MEIRPATPASDCNRSSLPHWNRYATCNSNCQKLCYTLSKSSSESRSMTFGAASCNGFDQDGGTFRTAWEVSPAGSVGVVGVSGGIGPIGVVGALTWPKRLCSSTSGSPSTCGSSTLRGMLLMFSVASMLDNNHMIHAPQLGKCQPLPIMLWTSGCERAPVVKSSAKMIGNP